LKWKTDITQGVSVSLLVLGIPVYSGVLRSFAEKEDRLWFRVIIDGEELPPEGNLFEIQIVGEKEVWRTHVAVKISNKSAVVVQAEKPLEKLQRREHFRVRAEASLVFFLDEGGVEVESSQVAATTIDLSVGGAKARSKQISRLVIDTSYNIILALQEGKTLEMKAKILSMNEESFTLIFEEVDELNEELIFQYVWDIQRKKLKRN
jgi:c-di-GMP-binding flagellar brake protein YcgR